MHQDPDAPSHGAGHVELRGREDGHLVQTDGAGRGGRERSGQIRGRREHDADDVVRREAVALEELREQLGRRSDDGLGVVVRLRSWLPATLGGDLSTCLPIYLE